MRLWEITMLSVLPREQLVSQWRECSSIAASIKKMGHQIMFLLILLWIMILTISFLILIMCGKK